MAIEKFMENMAAWDGGVKDLKELGTNICFHFVSKNQQKTPKYTLFTSPDPWSHYKNDTVDGDSTEAEDNEESEDDNVQTLQEISVPDSQCSKTNILNM